ncbi:hypothetical protein PENTCL1PPCAC_19964, partial [Pristionchus entomophagus]
MPELVWNLHVVLEEAPLQEVLHVVGAANDDGEGGLLVRSQHAPSGHPLDETRPRLGEERRRVQVRLRDVTELAAEVGYLGVDLRTDVRAELVDNGERSAVDEYGGQLDRLMRVVDVIGLRLARRLDVDRLNISESPPVPHLRPRLVPLLLDQREFLAVVLTQTVPQILRRAMGALAYLLQLHSHLRRSHLVDASEEELDLLRIDAPIRVGGLHCLQRVLGRLLKARSIILIPSGFIRPLQILADLHQLLVVVTQQLLVARVHLRQRRLILHG